jgi:ATP adenylyltransferase
MKYEQLIDFIQNRMSMSHVYQPVLLRALVDSGGIATIRQLAQRFLSEDESQLVYYEKRIKEMPVKVLKRHGVIESDGKLVSLAVGDLTLEQKANIRMLCEQRLQAFVQKRGLSIWDYRMLDEDPVPDSLRYLALKAAGGRCQLCGVTKDERPLDVDHIIPRARGGKNELANLQVLCSKCNRSKRDKDDTDFRGRVVDHDPNCAFCSGEIVSRAELVNRSVFAIKDKFPVTVGHMLVIPKRHATEYFSLTVQERADADDLMRYLRNKAVEDDPKVVGFNVGSNSGEAAGQTIMHAHIHLIPRRIGDTQTPRGGVRGVIPARQSY